MDDPQYKTPEGAALRIWREAAQNRFLTEQHGRPLFDECLFVEVITPGSRDSTPVFEVERVFCAEANRDGNPKRSPKYGEYAQFIENFKAGETHDASLAGTPLSQWPEMTRSMVATLKAANIFTLEALAALPDTKLTVVGPDGRTWREKAKAYVENAKNGAYATELAGRLEATNSALDAALEREKLLAQRVQQLETAAATGQPAPAATTAPAPRTRKVAEPEPIPNPSQPVAQDGESLVAAGVPETDETSLPII